MTLGYTYTDIAEYATTCETAGAHDLFSPFCPSPHTHRFSQFFRPFYIEIEHVTFTFELLRE